MRHQAVQFIAIQAFFRGPEKLPAILAPLDLSQVMRMDLRARRVLPARLALDIRHTMRLQDVKSIAHLVITPR